MRGWIPALRLFATTGIAVIAAALLAGCGGEKSGSQQAAPQVATDAVQPQLVSDCEPGNPGGRLVVASFTDPKTFNPITESETSSSDIINMMFIGLLKKNQQSQEMGPGLAYKWEVAEDSRTWTFHMRKGMRWTDGQPITADDVLFTINDVVYNKDIVNVKVDQMRVDGKDFEVTKVDDLTVRVVTPEVFAPFLEFFGSMPILPKHVLADAVREKRFESSYGIDTPADKLVCNGPFRLKQYKSGEFSLVERNPYYFEVDSKGQRLPYFDAVVYMVVPDQEAISLRFLEGQTDIQEFVRSEEFPRFKKASEQGPGFNLVELGIASQIDMLTFNQNTGTSKAGKPYVDPVKLKWFRNKKFRQAVSYAIDREAIVKSTLSGLGRPNTGFITESNTKWFNPDVMKYPHDPAKAKQLLAEIGIRDRNGDGWLEDETGRQVEFEMNTNAGNSRRQGGSVIVQDDLKRLGIKVNYQPLDFNNLVDRMSATFDFECIFLGLASESIDPGDSMNVLISSGFNHQWFPQQKTPSTEWEARIDALMNTQLKTLDFAERKKAFDEVQAILAEEAPMIFTAAMNAYSAARSKVRNLKPTPHHNNRLMWNVEELYFAK